MLDNGMSIKGMIQGMMPDGPGIMEGIVIKADPLNIQLTNDNKMLLGPGTLIVPSRMTNHETTVDIKHEDGTTMVIGAKMTIFNALKKGEKVYLLSFNNGKKYYVLDRVVS